MADEETPITGAALVAELNDLIQLDHDAIAGYTLAIESVESVTYRETLEGFRRDHGATADLVEGAQRKVMEVVEKVRGK
jgi:hypothetical protein